MNCWSADEDGSGESANFTCKSVHFGIVCLILEAKDTFDPVFLLGRGNRPGSTPLASQVP